MPTTIYPIAAGVVVDLTAALVPAVGAKAVVQNRTLAPVYFYELADGTTPDADTVADGFLLSVYEVSTIQHRAGETVWALARRAGNLVSGPPIV